MVMIMKKDVLLISKFILIFLLFSVLGATPTIELEVSEQNATQEADGTLSYRVAQQETFFVSVTVKNGSQDGQEVKVEGLNQFHVLGQSQSSNMQIINNQVTSAQTIQYQVVAAQQGTFILGPARIDGQDQAASKTIKIIVGAPGSDSARNVSSDKQTGHAKQQTPYTVVCKAQSDKKEVVVGEPLVVTLMIFVQGRLSNVMLQPPTFPDFVVKEVKKEITKEAQINNVKGTLIEKKFVLFPLKTGKLAIKPFVVSFMVPMQRQRRRGQFGFFDEDFFSSFFGEQRQVQKSAVSQELKIDVTAVPHISGKNIEGVGDFTSFKAAIDKTNAVANDPLLLTLTIEGKGNFDQITTPKLNVPDSMRWYESKTEINEDVTTQYVGGSKKYEFVIQCGDAGKQTIPAQTFTYFDTKTKTVKNLQTDPLVLNIQPRKGEESKAVAPALPSSTNEKPIQKPPERPSAGQVLPKEEQEPPTPTALNWYLFLLLALVPLLFFAFRQRRVVAAMIAKVCTRMRPAKKLSALDATLKSIETTNQYAQLYQFFVHAFEIKYSVSADLVTESWMEQTLVQTARWDHERVAAFLDFMALCAQIHFSSQKISTDGKELIKRAQYWFLMIKEDKGVLK